MVGWRNWTATEYTIVAASPLVLWLLRTGITTYYTYRIKTASERLSAQQKERTKTIDKLKAATKYNSTQELLDKYGGATPKPKKDPTSKLPENLQKTPGARKSMGPGPLTPQLQGPPVMRNPDQISPQDHMAPPQRQLPSPVYRSHPGGQADFALNAFSAPPQYAAGDVPVEGHWYDRVLDLLLGEDETSSRNRLALICKNCRLVNGQAPPGVKSLAELGKWRCFGCGTMNVEEDEVAKAVNEMKERIAEEPASPDIPDPHIKSVREDASGDSASGSGKEDVIKHEAVEEGEDGSAEDMVEVKPRRGRSSRKKTS